MAQNPHIGVVKALVLLPLVVVFLWTVAAKLWGRPVSPSQIRALVALLLAFYLAATAFLGLFWMSRMELPVFDWHYLMGYGLLLVALWHLWLEWPQLLRFFSRLREERHLKWFLLAAGGSGAVALSAVFGGLELFQLRREEPASLQAGSAAPTPVPPVFPTAVPHVVGPAGVSPGPSGFAKSEARQAVAYMARESSASLGGLVRRGLFFGPKVASLRNVGGKTLIPLPPPLVQVGTGLPGALGWLSRPSAPRCGACPLAELATLLFAANGVTEVRRLGGETVYLRAAPSAGALYPVEVYLVNVGAGELAPGVYVYVPQEHGLLPVAGAYDARAWARALGFSEGAVVSGPVVVFTTVFQRTVWKYGSRSYRYVVLDAGHAVANFWLVASALSWPVEVTPFFADPEVEALVGLSPDEEGVVAVGVFGRLPGEPRLLPAFSEVRVTGDWEREELTRLSHRLTRWQWTEGEPWVWQPRWVATAASGHGPDLLQLIKNRRSYRRFSPQPLSSGQLATLLSRLEPMAALVPGGTGVEVRAVVVRDEALSPGVYRWWPGEGGLQLVKSGSFGRALYRAGFSQELLERAAAAVVFSLDEQTLASTFGRRGFRVGLLATGMLGEVVYLAAGEVGLRACGVGAFADNELSALLELPEGTSPVYLVALGKE
ncbi:hypothetical protein EG19_05010 [Thermoanaerobaculum aquaticum]|uniref:Nitroreductase domain-containing protein n=2 Tax=Thermoanaerobaculum aquaticum TaxID=1312852 RepID=A0A062XRW7_9BACT|nr:hypothetical protein EG19_05010 [Thermoanaerobaculum aquaticum]BCW94101.1 MAG: hypothetical protein KatS3mg007_1995 [Thermoanaerobaculum sp.]